MTSARICYCACLEFFLWDFAVARRAIKSVRDSRACVVHHIILKLVAVVCGVLAFSLVMIASAMDNNWWPCIQCERFIFITIHLLTCSTSLFDLFAAPANGRRCVTRRRQRSRGVSHRHCSRLQQYSRQQNLDWICTVWHSFLFDLVLRYSGNHGPFGRGALSSCMSCTVLLFHSAA